MKKGDVPSVLEEKQKLEARITADASRAAQAIIHALFYDEPLPNASTRIYREVLLAAHSTDIFYENRVKFILRIGEKLPSLQKKYEWH